MNLIEEKPKDCKWPQCSKKRNLKTNGIARQDSRTQHQLIKSKQFKSRHKQMKSKPILKEHQLKTPNPKLKEPSQCIQA